MKSMINLNPIGFAETPFLEKFGIPRQASLLEKVNSSIVLNPEIQSSESFDGLNKGDLIWVLSYFHLAKKNATKVKAPRLGGNEKIGVFASRSPSRPNPIGLSLVRILDLDFSKSSRRLLTTGLDLVHQTPILDIKPYIAYSDFKESETPQWVRKNQFEKLKKIEYESSFLSSLDSLSQAEMIALLDLLEAVFSEDPRPAYQRSSNRTYFCSFFRWNIAWKVKEKIVYVTDLTSI